MSAFAANKAVSAVPSLHFVSMHRDGRPALANTRRASPPRKDPQASETDALMPSRKPMRRNSSSPQKRPLPRLLADRSARRDFCKFESFANHEYFIPVSVNTAYEEK